MLRKLSEKTIATRLKERFGAGTDHTKAFDQWHKSVQLIFRSRLKFEKGEVPIVAFYQANDNFAAAALLFFQAPPDKWSVITTRRILWTDSNGQVGELRMENIASVGWSSGPLGWPQREKSSEPDVNYPVENGYGSCASYSPWLQIVDKSGRRYDVFFEVGTLKNIRDVIRQLVHSDENALEEAR